MCPEFIEETEDNRENSKENPQRGSQREKEPLEKLILCLKPQKKDILNSDTKIL